MKGKDLACKILEAEDVRYIFGNPGSTEIPLLDNLCHYSDIKYVLGLHEGIVVSMADGYARASGRPGLANVHAAPGTAHSLGALFNAHADNVPLVLIAGQQDSRLLIREPFLSADLVELSRPLTKWRWHVSRAEELAVAMRRAFKEATTPPCGPVCLSISKNALDEVADAEVVAPEKYRVSHTMRGDLDGVRKAAELLIEAENPIVIAGTGVAASGAVPELVKLAEVIGACVYAEPGSFPADHELYAGPIEFGSVASLARSGDVLAVVGAKMFTEFFYTPSPVLHGTKAIHLDIRAGEIAKNCPVEAAIVADPKVGLKELVYTIQGNIDLTNLDHIDQRKARIAESGRRRGDLLRKALSEQSQSGFVRGACLGRDLRDVLDEDAIIVDQAICSSSYLKNYYQFRRAGTYYADRGGCLGWAIGAAMGVKLACPDKQVVAFTGDGGAMYYPQALWTAANDDIPIVVVLINNGGYSAMKRHYIAYNGEAAGQNKFIGADIAGIDYVKMAGAYGVAGLRVQEESKLKPALNEALNAGRPFLVEVVLAPDDPASGTARPTHG